mmetsp:Transcript_64198/g.157940  ORF Transcript_64198/g.157940 Transcript_64198/m.157940 type:complete len:379 (-) Transcript_64198:2847-3983(-)
MLTGSTGAGKTALALGIAKEIGSEIPFCSINSSELSSLDEKDNNIFYEFCRKAIGIKILENNELYEGEVIDIVPNHYEKKNKGIDITVSVNLKSLGGSLRLKLHENLSHVFLKKNVQIGDIIQIYPEKNFICIIGRNKKFIAEKNFENKKYISLPKGKVYKKKNIVQKITLHDLDFANAPKKKSISSDQSGITSKVRNEVDLLILKYIQEKNAELIPGVLFIDEAHALNSKSFFFLTRLIENSFSPIFILATNRVFFSNSSTFLLRKIPQEFGRKSLSIHVKQECKKELSKIIAAKALNYDICITGDCLIMCGKIAKFTSLRFVILLTSMSKFFQKFFNLKWINFPILKITDSFFFHYKDSKKLLSAEKQIYKIYRIF